MIRKYYILISFLFLLFSTSSFSQINILEGDTSYCQSQSFTLNAEVDTNALGTGLVIDDDTYSNIIDLGFQFVFYGDTFTQCLLSTNNYICFDISQAAGFSPWTIANAIPNTTTANNPHNSIFGPWHDVDPSAGTMGTMSYKTVGVAPDRKFIFSLCEVPMFSGVCNNLLYSGQIVLFEGSNRIETHIANKPLCPTWNTGQAIHGLQNIDGTLADVVPGRNSATQWVTSNEGYQFVPNGPSAYTIDTIPFAPYLIFSGGSVIWTDNGSFIGSGNSVTISNATTGVHEYIATVEGCYGSGGADTVLVTIGATAAVYTQKNVECPTATNGFAVIDIQSSNNPYLLYWEDANNNVIQSDSGLFDNDTLKFIGPGSYEVFVVDTNGCITNHPFTITSGTYIANLTYNPTVICKDEQITFTNTSNETVTTYNWSFGDGGTSNLPSSTHTYITAGDLPVTLSITNSEDGCFDDTTVTITVIDLIKANFTSSGSYCEGDSILFTDLSNMNPVTWEWSMGNGATGDVPIFYYIYPFAGSYIVSLTATDQQCGIDTYIDTIVINYIPYVSIGVDTFICPGQSMFFNAQNNGDSYLWYNGATTQTISPTFSGNTDISVVVNHLGCLAGDTISVLVDCSINMPNAFSPDANGKNDLFRPRGRNVLSYEMLVYNRWGNQVYSGKGGPDLAVGWDGKISGEEAEVGTYSYYLKGVLRDNSTIEKQGNITLIR